MLHLELHLELLLLLLLLRHVSPGSCGRRCASVFLASAAVVDSGADVEDTAGASSGRGRSMVAIVAELSIMY